MDSVNNFVFQLCEKKHCMCFGGEYVVNRL